VYGVLAFAFGVLGMYHSISMDSRSVDPSSFPLRWHSEWIQGIDISKCQNANSYTIIKEIPASTHALSVNFDSIKRKVPKQQAYPLQSRQTWIEQQNSACALHAIGIIYKERTNNSRSKVRVPETWTGHRTPLPFHIPTIPYTFTQPDKRASPGTSV
jgi:hypothetical protein